MTGVTGLLKIELAGGDVLLCDGGVTVYNGDTYTSEDATLGAISSIETIAEGVSSEIPALSLSFAPPSNVAVTALSSGAIQQSRVRLWIAEYDTDTGAVTGTPELRFIGFVDQPQVGMALREFIVSITAVPDLEALFINDRGNGLSSAFHKSLYSGETGHDNATGLSVPVAWGVSSPSTSSGARSGFGGFIDNALSRVTSK